MQLIFEKSRPGRRGFQLPLSDVPKVKTLPEKYCRKIEAQLPEVSELDLVRHFSNLSRLNYSVDTNFYPLGSCTMKYNPKFTEKIAAMDGFANLHPLLPQLSGGGILAQGSLEVLYNTERLLSEITGMAEFTTQPLAGAHGELTGAMLIAAYHKSQGESRKHVIVPDSSHGTNPASAAIAGYDVVVIPTDRDGSLDMQAYKKALNNETAAVMLTCPDTLGLFNPKIKEIADLAHSVGALMYYDGANLNAILGKCRPGDIGFDVIHLNLHKTFATPHGGGGPGAGPVGVCEKLVDFLPISRVVRRNDGTFALDYQKHKTIGYIAPFYGNFAVILKAYAYILALGKSGLIEASENAVLSANYCLARLKDYYKVAYDRICMHECVLSAVLQLEQGVHALDIAKYLIDKGFHPPTIYFPLIVKEAMMIEPTETESKETLDAFIEVMIEAAKLSKVNPEALHLAPVTMPIKRLDETRAAREPNLRWQSK
jgi:glycine dehydrogenase subunit 2